MDGAAMMYLGKGVGRLVFGVALTVAVTGANLATPALALTPAQAREEGDNALSRGDYGMAMQWYKTAAGESDAAAQAMMGWLFRDGRGVDRNYERALYWFRRAADQHHAGAAFGLGTMYEKGRGVPASHEEAGRWYRIAAEQGHAGAQNNLGWYYQNGFGVPVDYAAAAYWYKLAVLQGQPDAHGNLGLLYISGKGVAQNMAEGERLLTFAATNGDAEAAAFLTRLQAQRLVAPAPPQSPLMASAPPHPSALPPLSPSRSVGTPPPAAPVARPMPHQPYSVLGVWHPRKPIRDEGLRQMFISMDIRSDRVVFLFSCRYLDGSILSGSFSTRAKVSASAIEILETAREKASNDEHICQASMSPATLPFSLQKDDLEVTFDSIPVSLHRAGRG